jgi:hypothetical protein
MGKKLRDTKLGSMLKSKAPKVLNIVGDLLPDSGALGIIKNVIDEVIPDPMEAAALKREAAGLEREYLADIKDARKMYSNTDHATADGIANKIINYNLIILIALLGIQVYVIMNVDGQVAAVITSAVGTMVGALINERNTVVNFFFGSSKGSKDKDKK